jgi:hypothetical protein
VNVVPSARSGMISYSPLCPCCGSRTQRVAAPMPLSLIARPYSSARESRRCRACGWQGVRVNGRV